LLMIGDVIFLGRAATRIRVLGLDAGICPQQ
jgi:hypothetical protein